jgi:hypothetical protein
MKNSVFWDMAPCRSCVNRRFGGTYRLHLQVADCSQLLKLVPNCGFFYPEDEDDIFLRNVGSHKIYMAPHPRRRNSSRNTKFYQEKLKGKDHVEDLGVHGTILKLKKVRVKLIGSFSRRVQLHK